MSEPQVTGATELNNGGFDTVIENRIGYEISITLGGVDGSGIASPWPKQVGQNIMQNDHTIACYVTGFVVEPGNLYLPTSNGSIPTIYNNTLVTASTVTVDSDIFS